MDNYQLQPIQLLPPKNDLSQADMDFIEEAFSSPTVVRYLSLLLWNQLADEANIPIQTYIDSPEKHVLKTAFIKGGTSMLQTLLAISTNRARKLQEEAEEARRQERMGNGSGIS